MPNPNITVIATIIHRIVKVANQQTETPPIIREQLQSDVEQITKLIDFLDDLQRKHGLAHSHSASFSNNNTASQVLEDYLFYDEDAPAEPDENSSVLLSETPEQTNYRRITNQLTHALQYHIYQDRMTTGDHLPLIFYTENNQSFLYIALLSLTDSITIEESTGNILDTTLIDAKALKVACKINLSEMEKHALNLDNEAFEPSNYISWIQKGSTEKIVEYIQNFIPVKIRIDDKSATAKLMKVLTLYLKQSEFTDSASEEINNEVIRLLRIKAKTKAAVNIVDEIDPIISSKSQVCNVDISHNSFKQFRDTKGYSPTDEDSGNVFSPSSDPLNNYEKFQIEIGNDSMIKISGNQSSLRHTINLNEDDPDNPRLEISLGHEDLEKVKSIYSKTNLYASE